MKAQRQQTARHAEMNGHVSLAQLKGLFKETVALIHVLCDLHEESLIFREG